MTGTSPCRANISTAAARTAPPRPGPFRNPEPATPSSSSPTRCGTRRARSFPCSPAAPHGAGPGLGLFLGLDLRRGQRAGVRQRAMIRHDPRRHGLEHRSRDHAAVFHFRRFVNKNDHQILRFFGGHEPYERRGALSAILAAKRLLRRTGLARHGDAGDGGTLARALIDDLTLMESTSRVVFLEKIRWSPPPTSSVRTIRRGLYTPSLASVRYACAIWSTVTERLCPNEEEIRSASLHSRAGAGCRGSRRAGRSCVRRSQAGKGNAGT